MMELLNEFISGSAAWGVLLDPTDLKTLYATFEIPAGVGVNNARVVWNAAAGGAF